MDATDIKLDDDGDAAIVRGDFATVESDQIHIEHILISNKGYWFEHPLLGVGIINDLNENGSRTRQELKQNIRRQLVFDNFAVKKIEIDQNSEVEINAVRKI